MKQKRPLWAFLLSLAVFLGFILIAFFTNTRDYVNDSVFMIFILAFLYTAYNSFKLKPWIFLLITFAFVLHNMGIFGYYNVSPVFLQWDHITHLVGEFAAGVFVYNFFFVSGILNGKKNKMEKFNILMFIVLASLGIGVFVEFMEFYGYLAFGEGLGIFGHGLGDINTEFIDSEWFNTMFDLLYNFLGSLLGVLFCRYILKYK